MPTVTLGPYNTIAITAASGAYRLKWSAGTSQPVDLMNIGPGAVFIRGDADPVVNDPKSLELPANWAINRVIAEGSTGLGVIASADTTLSVRLSG